MRNLSNYYYLKYFFEKLGEKIHTWLRYVDDVFAIINAEDNPATILNEINKIDQSIQFTTKCEKDNKLDYLIHT